MKINGAYKFKTKATVNTLVSTYVKVEFYNGGDKITPDEYANILTQGFTSDFNGLSNLYYIYWTIPPGSEPPLDIFRTSVDISCRIVITIIGVNEKGNVIYSRVFDNAQQYGLFTEERIAELNSNGIQESIRLSASVPPVYVFPEINHDNTFSFYGVILGGMHVFGLFSPTIFSFPHISQRMLSVVRSPNFSYPSHSFKDGEILIDICQKYMGYDYGVDYLRGMPYSFYYLGDGVWRSDAGLYGSIDPGRRVEMIATKYPNVQNSIFPYDYILDIDRIITYPSISISDFPIIKDSKAGDLFRSSSTNEITFFLIDYFLGDDLIHQEIVDHYRRIPENVAGTFLSYFLYDGIFYFCLFKYDLDKKEVKTYFAKNVSPEIYYSDLSGFPVNYKTSFSFLTKNKTPQIFETGRIKMLPDFIEALLETYPLDSEKPFTDGSYGQSTDHITPGVSCYSSENKTLWRYYNSIFVPSEIEWKDKEV